MCLFDYQLIDWNMQVNIYKPVKIISMSESQAYKLNNQLILNGETIRWVKLS